MKRTVPKNWKPNNSQALTKWMDSLPIVYDLEQVIAIDDNYQIKKLAYEIQGKD